MKIYKQLRILSLFLILLLIGYSTSKAVKDETNESITTDTTFTKNEINRKLELARQYYIAALESFDINDSTQAVVEFEKAIKELDQLSYYPDIENNEEFNDLSKSLIEDYEKLIVAIDILNPETPIFALREKINTEVERIDLKKVKIHIPQVIPITEIELTINEHVEKYINYFMDKGKIFIPSWFYRSGYYFPIMRKIFKEEGMPPELIYLSLIESGLNPIIRSRANAIGLWQFIKSTGSMYGLKSNFWVDDRRNPEKATRAAAKHMKDLYDMYQDWHLVMAAYNSGAGRVNSAIKRGKTNNYWKIINNLPKETRGYVPQYIAITLIFMNPEEYGFYDITYAKPYECDTIIINDCYDLEVLAEAGDIDIEELKLMNPELVQSCTPPDITYKLKVPKSKSEFLSQALTKIPVEQRKMFVLHNVKKGETITSISKKYNMSQLLLVDLNDLERYRKKKRGRLPVGLSLKIPKKINTLFADNNSSAVNNTTENSSSQSSNSSENQASTLQQEIKNKVHGDKNQSKLIYVAKKNDNLKTIAEMFNVRTSDIRNWNDIPFGEEVREADSIDIWVSKSNIALYNKNNNAVQPLQTTNNSNLNNDKAVISHNIKKGETLNIIAQKYNVTVNSIKKQNNLENNNLVIGKTLKINIDSKSSTLLTSSSEKINSTKEKSNDNKAINPSEKNKVHKVQKDETLYSIARANNVSVEELREWNNIDETDKIKINQTLKLYPISISENIYQQQIVDNKTKDFSTYSVKKGDNLFSIAKTYGVNVNDIKSWNNLTNNTLKIGQKLKLISNLPASSQDDNNIKKPS